MYNEKENFQNVSVLSVHVYSMKSYSDNMTYMHIVKRLKNFFLKKKTFKI